MKLRSLQTRSDELRCCYNNVRRYHVPIWCPKCNAMLAEGTEKCPRCGKRISNAGEEAFSRKDILQTTLFVLAVILIPVCILILLGAICTMLVGR